MSCLPDKLTICFYLRIGAKFYGEQMIAHHWEEVQRAVKDKVLNLRHPDGTVSMKYRGQELFGIKYSTEMYSICTCLYPPELLRTGRQHNVFPNQISIEFVRQENEVLYRIHSYALGFQSERRQRLPLQPLIREWSLMIHRYERLRAELGSEEARRHVVYQGDFNTPEWRAMVGEEAIKRVSSEGIRDLLLESSCAGGYLRLNASEYAPLENEG